MPRLSASSLALASLLATAAPAHAADPLAEEHESGDKSHVLAVMKVESTIENLNDNSVQVFGTRREYKCPTGELIAESSCAPCTYDMAKWPERPANQWLYEMSYDPDDEDQHKHAVAAQAHFAKYFELEQRAGAKKPERTYSFFEYTGKKKAAAGPAMAMRVQFFDENEPVTGATIPPGDKEIEIEARAEKKGEAGTLEPYPEADIAFDATCGVVKASGKGKALFSLKPGFNRCPVKATAKPGSATATLVVMRATNVEIIYEGQEADEILLDGTNTVELACQVLAAGKKVHCEPDWKSEHGHFELIGDGQKVRFRLDKDVTQSDIVLTDTASGASDIVTVKRKAKAE